MCDYQLLGNFNVPGTKMNIRDGQVVTSTGHKILDELLGNGIPLGSMIIVEEDIRGHFSEILAKYYLAEGYACNHSMFLASYKRLPDKILSEIPNVCDNKFDSDVKQCSDDVDKLKIAWRYSNIKSNSSIEVKNGISNHTFDLSSKIKPNELKSRKISCWHPNDDIFNLIFKIEEFCKSNAHNLLRICITSLASPQCSLDIPQFLYALKCILRSSLATAFITVPTHLIPIDQVMSIRHISDHVIKLEQFSGTILECNAVLSQYHGYLSILKLPSLNSIVPSSDLVKDYVFKVKRKTFVIEKLLLPPGIEEVTPKFEEMF